MNTERVKLPTCTCSSDVSEEASNYSFPSSRSPNSDCQPRPHPLPVILNKVPRAAPLWAGLALPEVQGHHHLKKIQGVPLPSLEFKAPQHQKPPISAFAAQETSPWTQPPSPGSPTSEASQRQEPSFPETLPPRTSKSSLPNARNLRLPRLSQREPAHRGFPMPGTFFPEALPRQEATVPGLLIIESPHSEPSFPRLPGFGSILQSLALREASPSEAH